MTQRRLITTVLADIEAKRQAEIAAAKERQEQNRAKRDARIAALEQERKAAYDARAAESDQRAREVVTNRLERRYRALGKSAEFEANRDALVQAELAKANDQALAKQTAQVRRRVSL